MLISTTRKAFGLVLAAFAVTGAAPPAGAADSAVIIMYHRFGEAAYPSTNVTLDQFESHIRELKNGPYAVLPLPEIVARLSDGRPLPERTVGLSVDDAYLSAYTEAWPRLKAAGLPLTLFVATQAVDRKLSGRYPGPNRYLLTHQLFPVSTWTVEFSA